MKYGFLKAVFVAAVVLLTAGIAAFFISGLMSGTGGGDYVAHGGGAIDGHTLTNSLEAVENALSKGIKYVELDLNMTSDGRLVAAHDWETFRTQTGVDCGEGNPPTYEVFKGARIYGRYRPLTAEMIDSLFKANADVFLVTDKTDDASLIKAAFPDICNRIVVECFSEESYEGCRARGLKAMRSFHNFMPGGVNVVGEGGMRYRYLHFVPTRLAVFPKRSFSLSEADSVFRKDSRVRFVYVDFVD